MNKLIYYYHCCWSKNFVKLHNSEVVIFFATTKISWNQNLKNWIEYYLNFNILLFPYIVLVYQHNNSTTNILINNNHSMVCQKSTEASKRWHCNLLSLSRTIVELLQQETSLLLFSAVRMEEEAKQVVEIVIGPQWALKILAMEVWDLITTPVGDVVNFLRRHK